MKFRNAFIRVKRRKKSSGKESLPRRKRNSCWTFLLCFFPGLKDTLFDEYLVEDAVYLLVALILISISILLYTRYNYNWKEVENDTYSSLLTLQEAHYLVWLWRKLAITWIPDIKTCEIFIFYRFRLLQLKAHHCLQGSKNALDLVLNTLHFSGPCSWPSPPWWRFCFLWHLLTSPTSSWPGWSSSHSWTSWLQSSLSVRKK